MTSGEYEQDGAERDRKLMADIGEVILKRVALSPAKDYMSCKKH